MTLGRAWPAFIIAAGLARPAFAQTYALRGTIVTPTVVIRDGSVSVNAASIDKVDTTPAAGAIDVDGVIFPGLIDLHNHITWNLFPRWKPNRTFANRYEWQETAEYAEVLSGPYNALAPLHACEMNRYGELKSIINGGTATVGGAGGLCIQGLARNLDSWTELTPGTTINSEPYRNLVFPFQPYTPCEEQAVRDLGHSIQPCSETINAPRPGGPKTQTKPEPWKAVVAHVAEGVDASARREFVIAQQQGFLVPGFTIVHGVALQVSHFKTMKDAGVGFVWSPRSNVELYGRTADVASAKALNVTMAIAPDWSPSGSSGMLAELAYAERLRQATPFNALSARDLIEMATVNPAKLAGLESRIGRIAPGYAPDLIVMRKRPGAQNATNAAEEEAISFQALLIQKPADLKLVIIGGVPIFGEPALMAKLLSASAMQQTETITVCGESRVINVQAGTFYTSTPWSATAKNLRDALASLRIQLADFVECF